MWFGWVKDIMLWGGWVMVGMQLLPWIISQIDVNPSDLKHAGLDVFRVAKPGHLLLDCFIPQEEA